MRNRSAFIRTSACVAGGACVAWVTCVAWVAYVADVAYGTFFAVPGESDTELVVRDTREADVRG